MPTSTYTLAATSTRSFNEAVNRVRQELQAEGFGVLSEIDVQATLREKLDVERDPYLILGACNPTLAHQALIVERELGTLLPCNVVVTAPKASRISRRSTRRRCFQSSAETN